MARQPKPWYWKDRQVWCVTIGGVRHNLGPTKKEALRRFYALMQKPHREKVIGDAFPAIVDAFLEWTERNRAEATYKWYRDHLQCFVDHYPEITVDQLRPLHVENWASSRNDNVNTVRNKMRAVKRCCRWAEAQGYIERNPIARLEIPAGRPREVYVSPEEFQQILDAVTNPSFADLLRVTYETGCRPQELLRVEARHVDLQNARWVFPASEAKVKSMARVVYLSEHALQVSSNLVKEWPSGNLFRNSNGTPWTKFSVCCAFTRLQTKLGKRELKRTGEVIDERKIARFAKTLSPHRIVKGKTVSKSHSELLCEARRKLTDRRARQLGPRHSLYALRHSWATNALQRGLDALTVAILMGHKDPSMLARTYQHLSHNPEHLLAQARKASA